MATTKPRLSVTLEPEIYETYARLARLQGRSMSKLASEQLEFMEPAMFKVADLLQRVEQTTEKNREIFHKAAGRVDGHMEGLFGMIEALFDGVTEASAAASGGSNGAPDASDVTPTPLSPLSSPEPPESPV
jgi:hypothetical protein